MSGKGSDPRPLSVNKSTFDQNWDRIFGSAPTKAENREVKDNDPENRSSEKVRRSKG